MPSAICGCKGDVKKAASERELPYAIQNQNRRNINVEPKTTQKNRRSYARVGAFVLSQPKMLVSDPGYKKGDFGAAEVNGCKTGEWLSSFNVNRYEWDIGGTLQEDERVAAIFVRHESIKSDSVFDGISFKNGIIRYPQEWNLLSENIGVDSGQAGIFDASKYGDNDLFDAEGRCGFGDKWYSNCCDLTLEGHGGIVANMGVCAASGFGDGAYALWGHKAKDGQYDAMVLFFLEDDDGISNEF